MTSLLPAGLDAEVPRTADDPPRKPPVSADHGMVYVHFPYCAVKCPYCDYNSHVLAHDDVGYADAVLRELDCRGEDLHPSAGLSSVYFGGGTPSRWSPSEVGRVLRSILWRYTPVSGLEITLEANPGSVAEDRMAAYRLQGINRFSVGCQSFDDHELALLGRVHDAASGIAAVRAAKATGARVSLDLMYGLPNQTWDTVQKNLDTAIGLEPDHISAYTLTIEPHTVLARRTRLGLFTPMPDDGQAELIERVTETLEAAGYLRYEVSSYAKGGRVSLHNSGYWLGAAYLGLGAGAHSYLPEPTRSSGWRMENVKSPRAYVTAADGGEPAFLSADALDLAQLVADRLMVAFRTRFGLAPERFVEEWPTSQVALKTLRAQLEASRRQGFLEQTEGRYRPTDRGLLFNDAVARAMLEAADRSVVPGRVD